MMYHAITVLVFLAALFAYIVGSQPGAIGLFVVGLAIECYGWYRILRKRK